MPFTLRQIAGRRFATAVCDLCNEPIEFLGDRETGFWTGWVQWLVDNRNEQRCSELYISHKGCIDRLQEKYRRPNERWQSMELQYYIAELVATLNYDLEFLEEQCDGAARAISRAKEEEYEDEG